jgi:hypothetical protein
VVLFAFFQIKWNDLITRRQQSKVTILYRVIHQLVAIPSAPYLQPTGVRTRGNEMRFLVPFTSVNSYKNSFHTVAAYSSCGLTNVLQHVDLTSAGHDDRFLRRKAVVLFAFLVMMSIVCYRWQLQGISHSVTIEEQTVYHLCFTKLSGTTSSPVDNNPKSPYYTELSRFNISWTR